MNTNYISTLTNKELLRTDDPNKVYKRPIPFDMINKFVGLDSRILIHDDTVQKQAFHQGYNNFWSFVDFNMKHDGSEEFAKYTCNHCSKKVKPEYSMTQGNPCTGVNMTYQEARAKANQLNN